jgi:hypothetical protein
MPTAPVLAGAALGLVAVDWVLLAALVTEVKALEAELVSEPMTEVREARSEPVAVESTDDSDDSELLAPLVMDDSSELTAELMELTTEDECVDSDEAEEPRVEVVKVEVAVTVTCAAATEARARTMAVKRMVAACWVDESWKDFGDMLL